ncbi:MAG: transposase [Bacillota bacterium]
MINIYDEYYDCYICPNNQILKYSTTNRDGYREYKSDPKICIGCEHRMKCTQSKNFTKVITRHLWEPYVEIAEDLRYTRSCQWPFEKPHFWSLKNQQFWP